MDSAGQVLLTGASGFVGSAVARALLRREGSVRAVVRKSSPKFHLADLGLEFHEADLRDREAVRVALAGVRYVFHVAAEYRLWSSDPAALIANNLETTRIVMEEARRAGVERVVYTSSVATLAARADGTPADETMPLAESEAIGAYKRSKVAAERLVESLVADGVPAVIVNPSTPIGPCDVRPTPTGRLVLQAARGRMPGFVETGLNLVHVDDVAAGHIAALERGNIGERYILGGQNASLSELLTTVANIVGRPAPRLQIPRAAVYPLALMSETAARLTGREPFITRDGLRMSKTPMYFTAAKAERALGFRARPYAEGIKDAVRWFRQFGYLPDRSSPRAAIQPYQRQRERT